MKPRTEFLAQPIVDHVKSVQQVFIDACANGYLERLQAYGVGRGISIEEAIQEMKDGGGENLQAGTLESFEGIRKSISRWMTIDSTEERVSTGDKNVKEESPAVDGSTGENE